MKCKDCKRMLNKKESNAGITGYCEILKMHRKGEWDCIVDWLEWKQRNPNVRPK